MISLAVCHAASAYHYTRMLSRKRSLSQEPLGSDAVVKRSKTTPGGDGKRAQEVLASHEIFLNVLSFLDAEDLVRVEGVCRYWRQMSLDQQLWKRLYLARHATFSNANRPADWKSLVKVSTNWSNGNARLHSLSPRKQEVTSLLSETARSHIVALSSSCVFVAYPSSPLLHLYPSQAAPSTDGHDLTDPLALIPPPPGWSSPHRPDLITALAVDRAPQAVRASLEEHETHVEEEETRLAIWYASGGYAILGVALRSQSAESSTSSGRVAWRRIVTRPPDDSPARRNRRRHHVVPASDPVVLGALHWPILVACTKRFYIDVTRVAGDAPPRVLQTLHSPVSYHPAQLSLEAKIRPGGKSGDNDGFVASLAYSSPVYPNSWTLAVQKILIGNSCDDKGDVVTAGECLAVTRPRKMANRGWPPHPRGGELVGVKGEQAVGIGLNHAWGVIAGQDNRIQVYRLHTTIGNDQCDSKQPQADVHNLEHSQTLLAHASAITSISLARERFVSAGNDGRVLVWDLGADAEHVEVRQRVRQEVLPQPPPPPMSLVGVSREIPVERPIVRSLAFNEDTIVGLVGTVVRVWKFS